MLNLLAEDEERLVVGKLRTQKKRDDYERLFPRSKKAVDEWVSAFVEVETKFAQVIF